ncbi:MAG: CotH kinase family protein [Bacteroidales bacterium]|nr:CotH kinase family protein [Bacteroidales bacterium]
MRKLIYLVFATIALSLFATGVGPTHLNIFRNFGGLLQAISLPLDSLDAIRFSPNIPEDTPLPDPDPPVGPDTIPHDTIPPWWNPDIPGDSIPDDSIPDIDIPDIDLPDEGDNGDDSNIGDDEDHGQNDGDSDQGDDEGGDDSDDDSDDSGDDQEEPADTIPPSYDSIYVSSVQGRMKVWPIAQVDSTVFGTNVPTIFIDVEDGAEITSKVDYRNATLRINGYGHYDDVAPTAVSIRGRGNSTWYDFPKKPYRLKFSKKISLCGLTKAKSYCLIANYIDCTLARNAIAFYIAQQLEMPYTNHSIPVNLVVNGEPCGAYMLTEKTGINAGSVDLDETQAIMWEIDPNYDEDYKFYSERFELPVMVKDPDLAEIAEGMDSVTPDSLLRYWQADFQRMENALATDSINTWDYIDMASVIDYVLVYTVCANLELQYPKSMFLYKEHVDSLYKMGPVWDFDWAFTFYNGQESSIYTRRMFVYDAPGSDFFEAMVKTDEFMEAYKARWRTFLSKVWPNLLTYLDQYAALTRVSALENGELWPKGGTPAFPNIASTATFDSNVLALRTWLSRRVAWLNSHSHLGLY